MLGVIAAEQWGATSGCGAIGALTTLETLAQWQAAGAAAAARELEAYENAELYQLLGIAGVPLLLTLFAAAASEPCCRSACADGGLEATPTGERDARPPRERRESGAFQRVWLPYASGARPDDAASAGTAQDDTAGGERCVCAYMSHSTDFLERSRRRGE